MATLIIFDYFKVPDNSLKYMIKIESWPFSSNRNYLQIVMGTEGTSQNEDECLNTETSADGDNVQWFKINIEGISLYPILIFLKIYCQ